MILTGPRIEELVEQNKIHIDPYDPKLVGPNSVDLRLHPEGKVYVPGFYDKELILSSSGENPTENFRIGECGFTLQPGVLYLMRTIESIGSDEYVPMVEGRSSCGRLGLQVHMTAGFCDTGFKGTITLEMTVVHPLVIHAGVAIAQVFFVKPEGAIRLYKGRYQGHVEATASRMHIERDGAGR